MTRGLRLFLELLIILLGFFAVVFISGLRINLTPSMPVGLYYFYSSSPKRGDMVAVCLPEEIAKEGLKRHYLFYGHCGGHSMAVLKKLIAVKGDEVTITKSTIKVNGKSYLAPQQALDSNRLPIKHFIHRSVYHVVSGYWLYGSNDPKRSWDSRYFGGVKKSNIMGSFKPFFVLDLHGDSKSPSDSPPISPFKKLKTQQTHKLAAKSSPILAKPKIS